MIQLKTAKEISEMRLACQISAEVLKLAGEAVKPGVTTAQIDKVIYNYIVSQGAKPNTNTDTARLNTHAAATEKRMPRRILSS